MSEHQEPYTARGPGIVSTRRTCVTCGHEVGPKDFVSEVGHTLNWHRDQLECIGNLQADKAELEKQLGEAREALRPFAAIRQAWGQSDDDSVFYEFPTLSGGYVLVLGGDIERAHALLAATQPNSSPQKLIVSRGYPTRDAVSDVGHERVDE